MVQCDQRVPPVGCSGKDTDIRVGSYPILDQIQRTPLAEDGVTQEDLNIQRALDGTDTTENEVPNTVLDVIGSGGMPLEPGVRESLEDRMGEDFSDVRIHTGAKAAEAADAIDAKAFTCGNSIVFNSGEYDPQSTEGQFLLAHELAHVKQQSGSAPLSMMPKDNAELEIDPDPQLERQADQAAAEALSGEDPVTVSRLGTDVQVQRIAKDEVLPALALMDLENDPESSFEPAGDFQEKQNEKRIQFLKSSIEEQLDKEVFDDLYAKTVKKNVEQVVEDAGGSVKDDGTIILPEDVNISSEDIDREAFERARERELMDENEIEGELDKIAENMAEVADQIALTDDQREEIESGIDVGMAGDISTNLLSTLIGAVGGTLAGLIAAVGMDVAMRKWRLLDGDIVDRMGELQEELLEEAIGEMDTGEGDSTGDGKAGVVTQ